MLSLDERLSEIDRMLRRKLNDTRKDVAHRALRGDELAGALGGAVASHFIECASFHEKCEIRDTHGALSRETDLVFLNRFHPTFLHKDRPPAIHIEGVLAAAEVKTRLDKRGIVDCLEKARAFKSLVADVRGKDPEAQNLELVDWPRYLLRRPFFAFAYEDRRDLSVIQQNIREWTERNQVPEVDQIDAIFVLNKGVIINLGSGIGAVEMRDANGGALGGFVGKSTPHIFGQLILWLSKVCPRFVTLDPILLKYAAFDISGYTR